MVSESIALWLLIGTCVPTLGHRGCIIRRVKETEKPWPGISGIGSQRSCDAAILWVVSPVGYYESAYA